MLKKPQQDAYSLQSKSDGRHFYITRSGKFYHAFNDCARLVSDCMGYKLKLVSSPNFKQGTVRCGFPLEVASKVVRLLLEKYKDILICENNNVDLIVFSIKSGESIIIPDVEIDVTDDLGELCSKILDMNILGMTPLDSMNKLKELQDYCRKLIK